MTKRQGDQVLQAGLGFNEGNDPVYVLSFMRGTGGTVLGQRGTDIQLQYPGGGAVTATCRRYLPHQAPGLARPPRRLRRHEPGRARHRRSSGPSIRTMPRPSSPTSSSPSPASRPSSRATCRSSTTPTPGTPWPSRARRMPEAVEEFLRFLATPEAQLAFAAHNPGLVIQKAVVFEDRVLPDRRRRLPGPGDRVDPGRAGAVLRPLRQSGHAGLRHLVASHAGGIPGSDLGHGRSDQDDRRLQCRCRGLPGAIPQTRRRPLFTGRLRIFRKGSRGRRSRIARP